MTDEQWTESMGQAPESPATDKPKRARKPRQPRAVSFDAIAAEVETPAEAPASKPRARRSAKVKAGDVEAMVNHGSKLVVMFTGLPFWEITESEVKPWSAEAADLFNRIPGHYVAAAASFSGFLTVGIGIYSTMKPRIDMTAAVNAERRRQQREQAMSTGYEEAEAASSTSSATDELPWDA